MTESTENLVLEHLRAIRSDIVVIKHDVAELKARTTSLEHHAAGLVVDVLRMNGRFDQIQLRLDRIEQKLDLVH